MNVRRDSRSHRHARRFKKQTARSLHSAHSYIPWGEQLEARELLAITTQLTGLGTWVEQGPAPITGGQTIGLTSAAGNNPVVGAVRSIAVSTNAYALVGTVNGGIWKSTDLSPLAGRTNPSWEQVSGNRRSHAIGAVAISPANSAVAVAGFGKFSSFGPANQLLNTGGLIISQSSGNRGSWVSAKFPASDIPVHQILLDRNDPNVALVATSHGLYRTSNLLNRPKPNGNYRPTWTLMSANGQAGKLPVKAVTDLVQDPLNSDTIFAAVVGRGVYKSTNRGQTWQVANGTGATVVEGTNKAVNIKLSIHHSIINGVEKKYLYAGVVGETVISPTRKGGQLSGVYRSSDDGATWTKFTIPNLHSGNQGEKHFALLADPVFPEVIYIGGDLHPSQTDEGCDDWVAQIYRGEVIGGAMDWDSLVCTAASNTAPHADTRDLEMFVDSLLVADDGGLYINTLPRGNLSSSTGPSGNPRWESRVGDLALVEAMATAYDAANDRLLVATQDNGAAMKKTGTTWESIQVGDAYDVAVGPSSGDYFSIRGDNAITRVTPAGVDTTIRMDPKV
ncbi:MAG: hypothetical protein KDB23_30335, partial [Planctomycetales bacterium]|nr:hypothetical protein [Planctomycetales bacterium]